MAIASDLPFLVLHGLRVKGVAEAEVLAEAVAAEPDDVRRELAAAADEGLVIRREGRLPGWSVTAGGRQRHAQLAAAELRAAGLRREVDACYRRFLELNPELLAVCTAWQLVGEPGARRVNDHTDPVYDGRVVRQLLELHDRARGVCADLALLLERFRPYGERLDVAARRVAAGDHDWFTKPTIASYHTVWFELHEDLLLTLGLERATESQASA